MALSCSFLPVLRWSVPTCLIVSYIHETILSESNTMTRGSTKIARSRIQMLAEEANIIAGMSKHWSCSQYFVVHVAAGSSLHANASQKMNAMVHEMTKPIKVQLTTSKAVLFVRPRKRRRKKSRMESLMKQMVRTCPIQKAYSNYSTVSETHILKLHESTSPTRAFCSGVIIGRE